MHAVFVSVLLFTSIVMVLVAIISLARAHLLPRGDVTIRVNGEREVVAAPGEKLLAVLAAHDLFLPAACGGAGTCGLCRVRVVSGGGGVLPTERVHLSRADARRGVRLACQLAVRRDLEIELPPEIFAARRWTCRVRSNRNVATFIKETVLELPPGEAMAYEAGGYVQVEVPPHRVSFRDFDVDERYREEWERAGLFELVSRADTRFTRAYSMASWPGEEGVLRLNVRIATPPPDAPPRTPPGKASSWIFALRPGDPVTVAGPFGEFFIHESDSEMVYIGGGAGMAPLRSHILELLEGRRSKRRISYWYGARSLKEAYYVDEFEDLARRHANFSFHLALSGPLHADGWTGPTGLIHDVAHDLHLKDHESPEEIEYYLCGPPPMIRAARAMLDGLGVDAENIFVDDFGA